MTAFGRSLGFGPEDPFGRELLEGTGNVLAAEEHWIGGQERWR